MILTRYLIVQILIAIGVALAGLTLLFSFFELLSKLGGVSAGTYSLTQTTVFIGLQLPTRIHEVMPIAALLGGLFAFARLAQTSEYSVMRASAWSPQHAIWALVQIALLLGLITALIGEFVLPVTEQMVERIKTQGTQRSQTQAFRSGLWAKDGATFLNVQQILPDATLRGVRLYRTGDKAQLLSITEAARGRWDTQGTWQLEDGRTLLLTPQGPQVTPFVSQPWPSKVGPDLLTMLMVKPEHMSIRALHEYIHHLNANRQQASRYELALWKKLIYPLSPIVMLLISLPFAYYQPRGGKIGGKLMLGLGIGLAFHLISKASGDLALLKNGTPAMAVSLPLLAFGLAGLIALYRVERT